MQCFRKDQTEARNLTRRCFRREKRYQKHRGPMNCKPADNAFIESFNGKFRDECLSMHWFMSLSHARAVIDEWRNDYNLQRPHTSLKGLTPYEFACLAENRSVEYSNYGLHNNWG